MNLKLMTYNIQHGLDYQKLLKKERIIDLDKIIDVIKQENPDIVALNEVYNDINNIETVEQTKYIAEKLGYKYYFFGKCITIKNTIDYGNAIISKYPLSNFIIHKIPDPIIKKEKGCYESRVIIQCDLLINNQIIKIYVTHIGLETEEKENGINKIIEITQNEESILMGDFNMLENNKNIQKLLNVYKNPLLNNNNLASTYPSINPKEKIDYIFTKNVDVDKSYIVKKVASDHFPVIINIIL